MLAVLPDSALHGGRQELHPQVPQLQKHFGPNINLFEDGATFVSVGDVEVIFNQNQSNKRLMMIA